jgi:hypothetical protein
MSLPHVLKRIRAGSHAEWRGVRGDGNHRGNHYVPSFHRTDSSTSKEISTLRITSQRRTIRNLLLPVTH